MSYLFKLSLVVIVIFSLNACGGGNENSLSTDTNLETQKYGELVVKENLDAINPPILPLVAETPTVALKR